MPKVCVIIRVITLRQSKHTAIEKYYIINIAWESNDS